MNQIWLFLILSVCTLLIPNTASAQSDQILSRSGSSFSGTIVGATPAQVAIDVRGNRRSVPVNDIRRVMFSEEPAELNSGRAKALAGRLESAYSDLKRVDPTLIQRPIIKRDLQFFLAYCQGRLALTQGGDKQQAANSMLAFVRADPNSFHFFTAAQLLGDLAVSQGDYAAAVRYYGSISAKAPFPDYQLRASILEGRAMIAQGDFAGAEQKFDAVLSSGSDTAESKRQKALASVDKARCVCETASPQNGIKLIEEVIASHDPSDGELFGRAYNAQGHCWLKSEKQKEALMSFLHVDILFYSEPEIHAESLYYLSQLWPVIGQNDRGVAARNLLDQRYPGSVWSQK